MKAISRYLVTTLIWVCLLSFAYGAPQQIDKSFKLKFWDVEIGNLDVKAEIIKNRYTISSLMSARGIVSFFSKIFISSGALGRVVGFDELIPIQSSTRWHLNGVSRQTKLDYRGREVESFYYSPDLKKPYHLDDPASINNTIDPVSLILWLLIDRNQVQMCVGEVLILDGFRMSELYFVNKTSGQQSVTCQGAIRRISGFKDVDLKKDPLEFKLHYLKQDKKKFLLSKLEIETVFGTIEMIEEQKVQTSK